MLCLCKEGTSGNLRKDNVIHDKGCPEILTYSTVGNGLAHIIERNVIWSTNGFGIQCAADSIIQINIICGETIGLQPHQARSPSNQQILHNTVITNRNGIEVRGVSAEVVIANIAVYSQSGTAIRVIGGSTDLVALAGNVGSDGLSGSTTGYVDRNGAGAPEPLNDVTAE